MAQRSARTGSGGGHAVDEAAPSSKKTKHDGRRGEQAARTGPEHAGSGGSGGGGCGRAQAWGCAAPPAGESAGQVPGPSERSGSDGGGAAQLAAATSTLSRSAIESEPAELIERLELGEASAPMRGLQSPEASVYNGPGGLLAVAANAAVGTGASRLGSSSSSSSSSSGGSGAGGGGRDRAAAGHGAAVAATCASERGAACASERGAACASERGA
eukprot:365328-Chlamydomonas_euryale.AAC.1